MDADACPKSCLQIARKLAGKHNYSLITVASFNHQISNENHLIVGNENQAADIAIINQTEPDDIVITQDWGLAALVLGKKARAISPRGFIFLPEQMDLLLEERNILAKFRNNGGRTKGPAKRSREDDQQFEKNLLKLIQYGKSC